MVIQGKSSRQLRSFAEVATWVLPVRSQVGRLQDLCVLVDRQGKRVTGTMT